MKSGARQEFSIRFCILALLLVLCATASLEAQPQPNSGASWKFAVSGDSRNCGDIVMPAIAQGVRREGAAFYWHLGDYRAIYTFDEDYLHTHPASTISDYLAGAWPDFIQHQLKPFGELPVFLAMGNHEMISPMTREQYVAQFADWLDQPVLRRQRLADNPSDHLLKTYYHWTERGVDFINMDNASAEEFDAAQMSWFQGVLAHDAKDSSIRTVVLGMHAALPDSLSAGHSMNDSAQQQSSGRTVYAELLAFRHSTKKNAYVLASHSHFVMNNLYATACHASGEVLPGWIVGSAGAVRYRLPQDHAAASVAMTDVYGYLLATVTPDGSMTFEFKEIKDADVPASVVNEFSREQVNWCFAQNKTSYAPAGAVCPAGRTPTSH
ncbi:MAG: metallophosphoesterase [Candidatus Korobacteraceae bacterium]